MDKCPICEYRLDQCQCRFARIEHPHRAKRRKVVLDHLYLLSKSQLMHIIKLERWWSTSYTDPELNAIFDKMRAINQGGDEWKRLKFGLDRQQLVL